MGEKRQCIHSDQRDGKNGIHHLAIVLQFMFVVLPCEEGKSDKNCDDMTFSVFGKAMRSVATDNGFDHESVNR